MTGTNNDAPDRKVYYEKIEDAIERNRPRIPEV